MGKKDREQMRCTQDAQTGFISCEFVRRVDGGGEEPLARAEFQFDGNCRAVPTTLEGNNENLEKLRKAVFPLLKSRCKNLPQDY